MILDPPKLVTLKNNIQLIIRSPQPEDAKALIHFMNQLIPHSPYILFEEGEFDMTIEQERNWIEKNNDHPGGIALVGEIDGKIVAITNSFCGQRKKNNHVALLGTSVLLDFRGLGVGKSMMNELCHWGRGHSDIEFLRLEVMKGNKVAQKLYESLGFVRCGEVPMAYKMKDGSYESNIIMQLDVRS